MVKESGVMWVLEGRHIMVMAILVLYLGQFIKSKSGFPQHHHKPRS